LLLLAGGLAACDSGTHARELSREAVAAIEAQVDLLPADGPTTVWLATLTERLVSESVRFRDPSHYAYVVRVWRTPVPNAITTPDGHIYVTTGLLRAAASCAEVAGVVGHEIGHVVEHHAIERARSAKAFGCVGDLLFGDSGAGADGLAIAGEILARTAFSREDEAEADEVGVQLTAGAGFAPGAILGFHERLDNGREEPGFWATHPTSAARIEAIRGHLAALPADSRDGAFDCSYGGWTLDRVKRQLRGGM